MSRFTTLTFAIAILLLIVSIKIGFVMERMIVGTIPMRLDASMLLSIKHAIRCLNGVVTQIDAVLKQLKDVTELKIVR